MYEVEVKLRITDPGKVRRALGELGARQVREGVEEDTYFRSNQVDFARTDQALRLRKENYGAERWVLAYKGPRSGGASKSREEIEAEVPDPVPLMEILERLGFTKAVLIRKKRSVFGFDQFVISLDAVEGLGDFVEIEARADGPNHQLDGKIEEVVRKLRLDKNQLVPSTYLELLLRRK